MDNDQGFSVKDRRSAATGPAREERQQGSETDPMVRAAKAYEEHRGNGPADLDFSTFVISLATSAQVGLGAVPHPETNTFSRNIPAAKQMIDILAIVREKTRGNLTEPESALLEQVLFNLHVHYVRTVEEQKKSGG